MLNDEQIDFIKNNSNTIKVMCKCKKWLGIDHTFTKDKQYTCKCGKSYYVEHYKIIEGDKVDDC